MTYKEWKLALQQEIADKYFIPRCYAFRHLDSTNCYARQLAQNGALAGTLVVAYEQTAGRGRFGRKWESPAGKGLWFSIILRPKANSAYAGLLPFLPAIAVTESLAKMSGIDAGTKWPNDVMVHHKKICGILCEAEFTARQLNHAIIGIGLNVWQQPDDFPGDLGDRITSVIQVSQTRINDCRLLTDILERMYFYLHDFETGKFTTIIATWKSYCMHLNKRLVIRCADKLSEGIFVDLDSSGAAIIEHENGVREKVIAGESSVLDIPVK